MSARPFEVTWLEDRSDEGLLAEIRRVAALFPSRRLTKALFDTAAKVASSTIERRFGTWSKATRAAGLIDARPVYDRAAVLEDISHIARRFPTEPFTGAFYRSASGRYSPSHIARRFGGWYEALVAAGIADRFVGPVTTERMRAQPGRAISNEEILGEIRRVAGHLGRSSISAVDVAAHSAIGQDLLIKRFGSVFKALRQAGIEHSKVGQRYTEDEVFENLLTVWTYYGRPPTALEMDKAPSRVGQTTYIRRYGGWRKALAAFIARANSESSSPAVAPDPTSPTQPSPPPTAPSERILANITSPPVVRPRMARLITKPVDRREPGIGLRFKVLQRDKFRCVLCGRSPATELGCELHVDHIVPFSRGGKTTIENLRALCSHCNIGKSNHIA